MKRDTMGLQLRGSDREVAWAGRQTIEVLIDEIGSQSFPASDPPAWGVVSARLEHPVPTPWPPYPGSRNG
jgi:hypothetical protein